MQTLKPLFSRVALVCATCLALTSPQASAQQGQFSPAITVNDMVITGYELQQRAAMLRMLRAPGDLQRLAREQLIEDRLKLSAAQRAGVRPSAEEVADGMEEFAGRANLSREQFVKVLEGNGVSEETFRDFVTAGLSWRIFVRQKFGARSSVSEDEIDRALSGQSGGGNVRVLLSEIIMPMPPQQEATVRARAERISQLTSTAAFSREARLYSATATRGNGGKLPWTDVSDLPPALQPIVMALRPGQVSDPLPIPNAIALFQLRDIQESGYAAPEIAAVEYAAYYMPGGRSEETLAKARALKARVDRCDDLYGVAKGQPAKVLERGTLKVEQIPTDIAFELSKLDPGEVSTALTRSNGQTLVFLMLCGRSTAVSEDADRESISLGIRNRRLSALADGLVEQLKADARIVDR